MERIQFPVYFTKEEHKEFKDLAKKRHTTLNQLIRDALYSAKENPHFLNPTAPRTDLETLIQALEISAEGRIKESLELINHLQVLEEKINLLVKKAKIPQKEIDEIERKDRSGEEVFK